MLGRYSIDNDARVVLSIAANAAATSFTFAAPAAPFAVPADPAGDTASNGIGIATLIDSLTQPTQKEIVTYTSLVDNGNGTFTIGGVTRGVEGTMAHSWASGAVLFQALTANGLLHPYITANQTTFGGSLAFSPASVTFSGSTWNFGTASVIVSSMILTTLNGTTVKLGLQPTASPVAAPAFSQSGTTASTATGQIARFSADTAAPALALAKGRGSATAQTIVQNGDILGEINVYGARSSLAWTTAGVISFETDGTQTLTSMPSRIVFKTVPLNGLAPVEAMRISNDNTVKVSGPFQANSAVINTTLSAHDTTLTTLSIGAQPTTDPVATPLSSIAGTSAATTIVAENANAVGASLNLAKGRGATANTTVLNGDELGAVNWYGYSGTAWVNTGSISSTVDASVVGGAVITSIRFQLSANGISAPIDVLRVSHDGTTPIVQTAGRIGVGGALAPGYALTCNGAAEITGALNAQGGQTFDGGTTFFDTIDASGAKVTLGANQYWIIAGSTAAPTTAVNNAALPGGAIYRMSGTGGGSWTGLVAGEAGRTLKLMNASTGSVTLVHESASSSAANRFSLPGSANFTIATNDSIAIIYDSSSTRWRVLR